MNYNECLTMKSLFSGLKGEKVFHNNTNYLVKEVLVAPTIPAQVAVFQYNYQQLFDEISAISGFMKQDNLQILLFCDNLTTNLPDFIPATKELLEQTKRT